QTQVAVLEGAEALHAAIRGHAAGGSSRAWKWRELAIAASVAAAAVGLYFGVQWHYFSDIDVMTAAGEQKTVTLKDGSKVVMNESSRIHVSLSSAERVIELRAGEAIFDVARDPGRPFRVHTTSAVVRAVGTRFNVHKLESGTVVSVLDGRVQVA